MTEQNDNWNNVVGFLMIGTIITIVLLFVGQYEFGDKLDVPKDYQSACDNLGFEHSRKLEGSDNHCVSEKNNIIIKEGRIYASCSQRNTTVLIFRSCSEWDYVFERSDEK